MPDSTTLVTSALTIAASAIGAYLSSLFGFRNAEAKSRQLRRIELAEAAIAAADELRTALHNSQPEWTWREWESETSELSRALKAASALLPMRMRYLRRSIEDACGEALGMVARPELIGVREEPELAEFDLLWSAHARDYIDVAIDALLRWRDAPERHVAKVSTPTFDEWLRSTGRHPVPLTHGR